MIGYIAFVGTNSVRGSRGIYSVGLDGETLEPSLLSTHQVYNTGALELKNGVLYAASEGMTFKGLADGGIYAYNFDCSGVLTEIGAEPSHGQRACSISIDDEASFAYGANFYRGTFVQWPLDEKGAPHGARMVIAPPEKAGPFLSLHCVKAIGEKYVAVISLAEGALVVYDAASGERITDFVFPNHPFCRYLEVCGDYIYALMQDPGDVYVFKNCLERDGKLELIQTISTQRKKLDHYGCTTIRVTPGGELMLVATRSANSLSVYRIMPDGKLELSDIVCLPGETPRDFGISGDGTFTVTCLQKSDEICIHRIDYENATLVDSGWKMVVPSPAAMAVTSRL